MLEAIKNAFVIVFLVVGVYFAANFAGPVKNEVMRMLSMPGSSVKGASTQKAEEISASLGDSMNDQLLTLQDQIFNVRVVDAINTISRLQRVPYDVQSIVNYSQQQIDGVLQSREQKKKQKEKEK